MHNPSCTDNMPVEPQACLAWHTETDRQLCAMKEAQMVIRRSAEEAADGMHRLHQRLHALERELRHTQEALITAQRQR